MIAQIAETSFSFAAIFFDVYIGQLLAGKRGSLEQRKRKKQTGSSDTAAEQEAQPFSKAAPAMQKQKPKAQAKALGSTVLPSYDTAVWRTCSSR